MVDKKNYCKKHWSHTVHSTRKHKYFLFFGPFLRFITFSFVRIYFRILRIYCMWIRIKISCRSSVSNQKCTRRDVTNKQIVSKHRKGERSNERAHSQGHVWGRKTRDKRHETERVTGWSKQARRKGEGGDKPNDASMWARFF